MIFPNYWNLKRPGMLIPVFFLSLLPARGQYSWKESSVASLGNTFVTRPGFACANHNQAGLAWLEQNTISLQHARPFTMKELGISSIAAQVATAGGTLGAAVGTFGITGLRQTDLWISYGMKLHREVSAGAGIHCWSFSSAKEALFNPGISLALGIQAMLSNRFRIGAHVFHPVGWSTGPNSARKSQMILSTGFSWDFIQGGTYYQDLRFTSGPSLQTCHGLEITFKQRFEILFGMHNHPFSVSGGITLFLASWTLQVAFEMMTDSGGSPYSSFTYGW